MKAKQYDGIRTTVGVESDAHPGTRYPAGARGAIVEAYKQPREGYAIDLMVRDTTGIGDHRYDHVVLRPEQFEMTEPYTRRPARQVGRRTSATARGS